MKSLSIVVLLGTLSAIVLGAIFAIAPALAGSAAPQTQSSQVSLPAQEEVAPVTGSVPEVSAAEPVAAVVDNSQQAPAADVNAAQDPATALASTFTIAVEKDTASAESQASTAAQQAAPAIVAAVADLDSFVASVASGDGSQVAGIYVEGVLAYGVVHQPRSNAAFVSEQPGVVTQFALAAQYGSQAFLAHNYLAGAAFESLSEGDVITVVYGNGVTANYQVSEINRFQALSPDSTQSSFVDLASGDKLSNSELFHNIFDGKNSVVLQTCIAQDGVSTWGRLFITAVPLS